MDSTLSFEPRERDLLARIGKLKTKSGAAETPLLLPVVNPTIQPIAPKDIRSIFGFEALITNAYIVKRRFQEKPMQVGIHKFLDFSGVIMTDSGAYQILVYGDIETSQEEVVQYQEQIDTDIATILDLPTAWKVNEKQAEQTVRETLKRARHLFTQKTRNDVLWVGPVQGGRYLNLVKHSAKHMGKMPFDIYALGSPTEVMERYRFEVLVDMIMTAKMSLPIEKPLHLFGAGHPFMFSLAVALGCDMFDSAAYALYARQDRYMTETGTARLNELDYFPCTCPKCANTTPKQVMELPKKEKQVLLAEHNLYVCAAEIRRIRQAIRDGRLWEHMEMRAHSHPSLLTALKRLRTYEDFIERHNPATKPSGLFYFNSLGLPRPEIVRYRNRLASNYAQPKQAKILALIPQTHKKPFHKSQQYKAIVKNLRKVFNDKIAQIHTCVYAAPFGVIPTELDEVYPLSQHETTMRPDKETIECVAKQVVDYINGANYSSVIFINDPENWNNTIHNAVRKKCTQKGIKLQMIHIRELRLTEA